MLGHPPQNPRRGAVGQAGRIQYPVAGEFEFLVKLFERVGGIFSVRGIQVEQYVHRIEQSSRLITGPQTQQTKNRQIVPMHAKKHTVAQHKSHRHAARARFRIKEEI